MPDNGSSTQQTYDPKALGQQLGNKLTQYVNTPAPHPPLSGTTTGAWGQILSAVGNSDFQRGTQGAISDFADIASGDRFGMDDPGYQTLRQNVIDDATTAANAPFIASGRFGAGSHAKALGEGVGNAVASLDYGNYLNDQQRQERAASALPGILAGGMIPGQTQLAIGQMVDEDQMRHANADYDRFAQLLGLASGAGQIPGMQPEVPLWEKIFGYGAQLGGTALGTFARGGF